MEGADLPRRKQSAELVHHRDLICKDEHLEAVLSQIDYVLYQPLDFVLLFGKDENPLADI